MKDHRQRDRQSLANSQYRSFMGYMKNYLSDHTIKGWAIKESESGSPNFVGQIDPSDNRISGFGYHYTKHIHDLLVVSFNIVFQAGLREMCRTEIICSYALADNEKEIHKNPNQISCYPLDEEDVLEKNDPYISEVWRIAEKMDISSLKSVRKSDLISRGHQNMEEMAECAAAFLNPMVMVAIGAKKSKKKRN